MKPSLDWAHTCSLSKKKKKHHHRPLSASYLFLLLHALSSLFMLRYTSPITPYADGQSCHEFWPRIVALTWFIPDSQAFYLHTAGSWISLFSSFYFTETFTFSCFFYRLNVTYIDENKFTFYCFLSLTCDRWSWVKPAMWRNHTLHVL